MDPYIEHTFYSWLIVTVTVAVAVFVGSVIDRVRMRHVPVSKERTEHVQRTKRAQ